MKKGDKKLHFIDRYFGIPIVYILGSAKKKKKVKDIDLSVVKKVSIINLGSIGDTVLLFGIIKDLKQRFPGCTIAFFSGSSNSGMARLCSEIDKVVTITMNNPLKSIDIINREGPFDILIDCMPWPRISSIICSFVNAKLKIGYKSSNQHRHFVYDIAVPHSEQVHELENMRNLVRALGVSTFNFPSVKQAGNDVKNENIIVIHMYPSGINSYLKKWPEESWSELIHYLTSNGLQVYLTGGKTDEEHANAFVSDFKLNNVVNLVGKMKIDETLALINSAKLVISVNTGVMHLAACSKVNVICLNGPTSAKRWGPVNDNSISINSKHKDAPCLHFGFEYSCGNSDCNCMALISVQEVIEKVRSFNV